MSKETESVIKTPQKEAQDQMVSPVSSTKHLKNIFKNLKNDNSKNISRTFSGAVADSVGSVQFQIVP